MKILLSGCSLLRSVSRSPGRAPGLRRSESDRVSAGVGPTVRGRRRRQGRPSPSPPRAILPARSRPALPADVFFSADTAKMDSVEKAGLVQEGRSPRVPLERPGRRRALRLDREGRLGEGPRGLPEDRARRPGRRPGRRLREEVADREGRLERRSSRRSSRRSTFGRRSRPSPAETFPAGIVYRTDAAISKDVKVAYTVTDGPPITYSVAPIASSKHPAQAAKFVAFLDSPAGRADLREAGLPRPARCLDLRRPLDPAADGPRGRGGHAPDPAARGRSRLASLAPRRAVAHAGGDPPVPPARAAADGRRHPAPRRPPAPGPLGGLLERLGHRGPLHLQGGRSGHGRHGLSAPRPARPARPSRRSTGGFPASRALSAAGRSRRFAA